MKRLLLLFSLICAFSITSFAQTWELNTWLASGELNDPLKLPTKVFKSIDSDHTLLHIDIPAGIQLLGGNQTLPVPIPGNLFGLKNSDGGYYKWNTNIKEDAFYELYTGGDGGDAQITSTFICYQIIVKVELGKNPKIYFSSVKPTPKIMTWTGSAFSDVVSDTPFTLVSNNIYKLEIPNGSTPATPNDGFLIKTTTGGGDIVYKSALFINDAKNTWGDIGSENTNDIAVAEGTYYKILFDAATKKAYASTIPFTGITPAAPKVIHTIPIGPVVTTIELTAPTEIVSVNPAFIKKAIVTRTVDGVISTIEPVITILNGKISYIDATFDMAKEHTYSVKYEYIDYPGSTETLTTEDSPATTISAFAKAVTTVADIKHDVTKGKNTFIGAKITWAAATNINDIIVPTYTLSYTDPITSAKVEINGTAPTEENGTYTQYVYGIPLGSKIIVETNYKLLALDIINVAPITPDFTYDIDGITPAPTGLAAKDLIRHGNVNKPGDGDGKYTSTISWNAPVAVLPIAGYAVKYGDANVTPIALTTFAGNWEYTGVQKLLSEGITFTGANNVATIKYSVEANYNLGNKVQTEITDEDYARTADIAVHASVATTLDVLFDISIVTGVENATTDVVAVYPNPTTGTLVINNTTPIEKISIFNLAGSCVREINGSNDNSTTINIEDLSQGTYFVKVNNTVTKVIKK